MSLFDIFKKKKKETFKVAPHLDGTYPWYSQFGTNIYDKDAVQQAIYAIVTELKKLDIVHVRKQQKTSEYVPQMSDIQKVLDNPNPLMTTCDFIEKIAWNLLLNCNAFVYPLWENNKLKSLTPLQPTTVEFLKDNHDVMWIAFKFANGYECEVPYENIIHIRYKYSVSEFMGGNANGQPDNEALKEAVKVSEILLKGLAKSLKLSTSVLAGVKIKTMQNTDDQIKYIKDFERKIDACETGLLPLDISADLLPFTKDVKFLDQTTLDWSEKKIFRMFGVSIPIIDGEYDTEEYEAFYQKTIKPIVKSLSQAFTKGIFSKRELGFENRILFSPDESAFYTKSEKIEIAKILVDSSSIYKNTLLRFLGFPALPEFEGQIAMSSNKQNAENNSANNNSVDGGGADE